MKLHPYAKAYIIHVSGYHIGDISPVPTETDIIVKTLFCLEDKRGFLHGAGDEARTRYLHLGKVALYRMSYTRINR